jgi:hypothetical protein
MAGLWRRLRWNDIGESFERALGTWTWVFWALALYVTFSSYQTVYQRDGRRIASLQETGILSAKGEFDAAAAASLSATAQSNAYCWALHPVPAATVGVLIPDQCNAYLPHNYQSDVDAAHYAAAHPNAALVDATIAAAKTLVRWTVAFIGLAIVAQLLLVGIRRMANRQIGARASAG